MIELKRLDGTVIGTGSTIVEIAQANRYRLRNADLCSADLSRADLSSADLCSADLSRANLSRADLRSANLSRADLCSADLRSANLSRADLCSADLRRANLCGADLRSANLSRADLGGANLIGADLGDARHDPGQLDFLSIVPDGDIIGWKKLHVGIAKLLIPAHAKRSNATGRKCRASEAVVLELIGVLDGVGRSMHNPSFTYEVGKTVFPSEWCEDRWQECAGGIHFFITRSEAENYV